MVIRFEKASIVLMTVSLASVLRMNGRASFVVGPVSVQCKVWSSDFRMLSHVLIPA